MFMPGLDPSGLGWIVHRDFARAVEELGHQFEIVTTLVEPGQSAASQTLRVLPASAAWQAIAEATAPFLRTRQLLPAASTLARYLRTSGTSIDLLHVEVAYPQGAATMLAVSASGWRGPVVVTPMGEDVLVNDEDRYGFRRYALPNALVKRTLRRAAFVRCISPLFETWIAQLAPHTPRRVVPLNISAEAAQLAEEPASQRRERRLRARHALDAAFGTAGRRLVVALGRLHPFKGIETLVRAMPAVTDATLLIVGPSLNVPPAGDTASHLLAVAREVGVGDRVQWAGAVPPERALDFLAGADVVAVPSRLESLNKVSVEAAAVGTPFVVTQTTGISAWVPDDGVGIVIPPNDPGALAQALSRVVAGEWRFDAERSAAFVRQFAPRTVAQQMVDVYDTVVAGSQGRAERARP